MKGSYGCLFLGARMNRGFSLLELLVVVAIVGALAAAGVVGYQNYTVSAKLKTGTYNVNTVFRYLLNVRQQIPLAEALEECEIRLDGDCVKGTDDPIRFLQEFRASVTQNFGFKNPIYPDCPITLVFYNTTLPETTAASQYGIVQNATSLANVSSAAPVGIPSSCKTQSTGGREYIQGAIYFQLLHSNSPNPAVPLNYFPAEMYMPCQDLLDNPDDIECI